MKNDIKRIALSALSSIDRVLDRWAPGGKRQGHEYVTLNPTRSDSKPGSFSINLNTGAWGDFATGDKGGDLVALVAYIEGTKQGAAADLLADFLGIKTEKSDAQKRATTQRNPPAHTDAPAPANKPAWRALQPVPKGAPQPPKTHPTHGTPSMRWEYRDADGGLLSLVYRFEPKAEGERKQFCPLTFCEDATGKRAWRWQGMTDPRPLYHLDQLAARPDAVVIVCEGEKAADAAALLFPEAVAVTMLNGAQAPAKTDWTPLSGRTVWLWPDNDAPGMACMASVSDLLGKVGAAKVLMFDLSAFAHTPSLDDDGKPILNAGTLPPEKWDAADALAHGWTDAHIHLMRSTEGRVFIPPPLPSTAASTGQHRPAAS